MKFSSGVTIIELIITIVALAILLSLGVVGMRGLDAQARDAERQSDIEIIARGLESRYTKGASYTNDDGTTFTQSEGSYVGHNEMWDYVYYKKMHIGNILPGVSNAAITSPSGLKMTSMCFFYGYGEGPIKCDVAEKQSNIQEVFADGSGGWKDIYIYEFIGQDKKYCNGTQCTRYNLYWISETDKTVFKGIPGLKVLKSKRQ